MQSITPITSLHEEQQLMSSLLELMQQEQQFLLAAAIEELTEVTARKSSLVGQLSVLASRRHAALAGAGYPAQEDSMDAWLVAHGDSDAQAAWSALLELTRSAKETNRLNGMLVNKHLVHTQGALNTMHPAAQSGNFYGPSGQTTTNNTSRRVVIG
ncbi:flagella synthesis protein FlgN [Janthinobacterium agaricidamnosum]|uniref:FlgN family protein n=1 Tax=Janthinobacterium agaricidamnosum NBRC 102515 = DSM 9628 TaxID=1349767 RepID=W0V1X8_9BURK|nr:flagellar protein FlgN [Janthinobacterium agaricidamnosum]CDG81871.1 flgN family protein [Janthinobacterium agaricidamnosum NBRC 102515 = DSM 9628]